MAQGPSDTILVAIRVTLKIRESKVRNPDPPDRQRFVLSEHIFLVCLYFQLGSCCWHQSAASTGNNLGYTTHILLVSVDHSLKIYQWVGGTSDHVGGTPDWVGHRPANCQQCCHLHLIILSGIPRHDFDPGDEIGAEVQHPDPVE